jgi:Alkylmercury lyase
LDARAIEVRNLTYAMFVEAGRAPSAAEVAAASAASRPEIETIWRELHAAHALVLEPGTAQIRMANPFSAVPTDYRVHVAGRSWYANCAWDAVGICAAFHADGRIETSCPDCGASIDLSVQSRQATDEDLRFHCLVPASRWWEDIVFT